MVYEAQPDRAGRGGYGRVRARLVFTVLGIAALLIGAVLNWVAKLAGNKLTLRSLIQDDFTTRADMLRTVGAISALIAVVALLGLLDRSGRLTRLAGILAVVVFAMFAVQVFRHDGENFAAAYRALRPGAWCQLGAGVLLLLGGLIRYRRRSERPAAATKAATEREAERERELVTANTVVQRPVTTTTADTATDGETPAESTGVMPAWRIEEQSKDAVVNDDEGGRERLSEEAEETDTTAVREPVVRGTGS
jgi:hypothetical protein